VNLETDCALRQLAMEFGGSLRPDLVKLDGFRSLFEALQLGVCNQTNPPASPPPPPPSPPPPPPEAFAAEFFVSSATGDDSAAGTIAAPFRTALEPHSAASSLATPRSYGRRRQHQMRGDAPGRALRHQAGQAAGHHRGRLVPHAA